MGATFCSMTHEEIFNRYVDAAFEQQAKGNSVAASTVLEEMRAFVIQHQDMGLLNRAKALMCNFPEFVASLH